MAGYNGYSKSNNAIEAESNGLYPISIAVKMVAKQAGCTQKQAREALETLGYKEWHHTSKKYNITYYYNVQEAVDLIVYGVSQYTSLKEDEELEKRAKEISELRKNCTHDWEEKFRDVPINKGGGRVFDHFTCKICGTWKK